MRLSFALLLLSIVGLGVGVGWWVHPGAGLALASLVLGVVAVLRDSTPKERRK